MKGDLKSFFAESTVAVTGGAGFIGSHLVDRLLEAGAKRIVVIDSFRCGDRYNLPLDNPRVALCELSLGAATSRQICDAIEGVEYLFHLAAEKHNQSKDTPARFYQANIVGTHDLYDAAGAVGVKKIVYTSSLYAYGRLKGEPFIEDEVPAPHTVYGISKLSGEHLLRYAASRFSISYNSIRYMFIYGPKQFAGQGYKSVILKNFERLIAGNAPVIFGDGKQVLDYLFVDDAVEATMHCMASRVSGEVFNIGSGEATSVLHLTEMMREVVGEAAPKAVFGPADWTAGTCRVGNVERAKRLLGWQPATSLKEGLVRTYAWLREQAALDASLIGIASTG